MNKVIFLSVCFVLLVACTHKVPSLSTRVHTADVMAKKSFLQEHVYKTGLFDLFTYSSDLDKCEDKSIKVYVEGDGFAWRSSSSISKNPTPINPMSLKLMVKDKSKCKLYIARPCQYVFSSKCEQKYWSSHRFSDNVIQSTKVVLDKVKKKYKNKSFTLYGYSGGAAVAMLSSVNRNDIDEIVTIAGNIDTDFWVKKHYLTPLNGSLNPANYSKDINKIKQIHLIGSKDSIVDISIYNSYKQKSINKDNLDYIVYDGFTHTKGWDKKWQMILEDIKK